MRGGLPLLLLAGALLHGQQPPATLEGDVVDATTGVPVPGARIKLDGRSAPLYTSADAAGHFHFDTFQRGNYSLSVDHPGFLPVKPIPVNGTQTIRVQLTAGAILSGTVTDPNGLPATGNGALTMRIFARRAIASRPQGAPSGYAMADGKNELVSVSSGIARIDDRGQYRSGLLEPGVYYVAVAAERTPGFWDRTWRTTYYPGALDADSARPIELAAGQRVRADIQVIRQAGVGVTGRLTIPSLPPTAAGEQQWTNVYLRPLGSQISASDALATVVDHRFEALSVFPGRYALIAQTTSRSAPGEKIKSLAAAQREVEIGDRDVTGLDLDLQPLAEVTGKVIFPEGCAAAPVRVTLQSSSMMGVSQAYATTGPDGAFAFSTFAPGRLFLLEANVVGAPRNAAAPTHAPVFLGDRDITNTGFDYPAPAPPVLRIVMNCAPSGGAR